MQPTAPQSTAPSATGFSSPAMASAQASRMPLSYLSRAVSPTRTPEKRSRKATVPSAARRKMSMSRSQSSLNPKRLHDAFDVSDEEPSPVLSINVDLPRSVDVTPTRTPMKSSLAPKLSGMGGALLAPDHHHDVAVRRDPDAPPPTLTLDDDDAESSDELAPRVPSKVVSRRLVELCAAMS
jgi:hypothetical protein